MKRWQAAFLISLVGLSLLFVCFRGPNILGDTPSYIQAIHVLEGQPIPTDFIPNRLLTTFGGLEVMRLLSVVFGGIYPAWFFINLALYILSAIVFFKLLEHLFDSGPVAYLGALFLAGNYGYFIFGLNYLLDIGGWAFYIFSIYFLYRYSKSHKTSDIIWSAAMVGIGGLFKEYAFLGAVAIAVYLVIENRRAWKTLVLRGLHTGIIALLPIIILYIYIYNHFGYTYLDWLGFNSGYYTYHSRIVEYVKAFGSLLNFLAFMVIGGVWILKKRWNEIGGEVRLFVCSILVSFLPIFFWPAITQRIITITVPCMVIISCFFFKKYETRWFLFVPVLILYVLATFFMDSYILGAVHLPL